MTDLPYPFLAPHFGILHMLFQPSASLLHCAVVRLHLRQVEGLFRWEFLVVAFWCFPRLYLYVYNDLSVNKYSYTRCDPQLKGPLDRYRSCYYTNYRRYQTRRTNRACSSRSPSALRHLKTHVQFWVEEGRNARGLRIDSYPDPAISCRRGRPYRYYQCSERRSVFGAAR